MSELRGSATLTVSGEYDGSYLKANAVDGNTSTEWACSSQGSAAWIQFDWGSPVTIREIRLLARPGDVWGIPKFTFSDASYAAGIPPLNAAGDVTYVLLCPKTTTSLRISVETDQISGYATAAGSNTGFKEIYINDAYSGTPPSTDLTVPSYLSAIGSTVAYSKWLVLDGNTGNEWASNSAGSGAWIQWNYTAAVYIESIQLRDRSGGERWGYPRFTFDDASYEDGGVVVGQGGYTTYTLAIPKTSTSLRVSIASGSSGSNIGLAEAIVTGNVTPPGGGGARINATGVQVVG